MLQGRCGLPAPLASAFGVKRPLRAGSPRRLEAALVIKGRCGLPARAACKQLWCSKAGRCLPARAAWQPAPLRTVWKQLWCSNAAAGCQPAPLASSFGAQRPLQAAASPHGFAGTLVLQSRCGLPARTAGSSFGAQRPLRAASPHCSALAGIGQTGLSRAV